MTPTVVKYAPRGLSRVPFAALVLQVLLSAGLFSQGCALYNALQDCPETECPSGGPDAARADVSDADTATPDAAIPNDTSSTDLPDVLDDTTPTPGPCDACPGGHCLDGTCVGIAQLVAGGNFTCALLDDAGAGRVACWGDNSQGQCGQPDSNASYVVAPALVPGLAGVRALAAGQNHVCALGDDGVMCWGNNTSYQLGHEQRGPVYEPTATTADLSDAVALSAGEGFTCALFPDVSGRSNVRCWGSNVLSQLGVDPSSLSLTAQPQPLPWHDVKATALGSGWNASCVLRRDDTVYCWGDNEYGQLGRDMGDEHGSFPVAMLSDVKSLALGQSAACALVAPASGKAVHCWGRGTIGQLGDGTTADRSDPREVEGLDNPQQVFGGLGTHFCALVAGGQLHCWGQARFGQFGDVGQDDEEVVTKPQPEPIGVLMGSTFEVASLVSGIGHVCALTTTGAVQCWGNNANAQLAIPPAGSQDHRTVAQQVRIVVDMEDSE